MTENNNTAYLVGVGPGDPDLIPVASQKRLQAADCIAGFKTVNGIAAAWAGTDSDFIDLSYRNQEAGLEQAASLAAQGRRVVFTAWGDFNFSGNELVARIERACEAHGVQLDYIPGISSLQVAFARTRLPVEDSLFITLHRRDGLESAQQQLLHHVEENRRHLLVLPHTFDMMPAAIAAFLLERGQNPERRVCVMERLSAADEKITDFTLQGLSAVRDEFSDLSIVVLPVHTP